MEPELELSGTLNKVDEFPPDMEEKAAEDVLGGQP